MSLPQRNFVTDFESVDYFTDPSLVPDPYPYFDFVRSTCPVARESHQGVLAITGHKEALAVYRDAAFSACVSVVGPFSGFPFKSAGDDISALLQQHRSRIPMSEHIVTQDPPENTRRQGRAIDHFGLDHGHNRSRRSFTRGREGHGP